MTTAAVLKLARAKVERGWLKGDLWDDTETNVCAVGAVRKVTDDKDRLIEALGFLRKVAHEQHGHEGVIAFNDAPSTTKEMVLAAFDAAIQMAEGR